MPGQIHARPCSGVEKIKVYRFSLLIAVQCNVPFWLAISPLHLLASRMEVLRQWSLPSLQVAESIDPCSFTSLQVAMYDPGGSTPLDSQFRIPLILATPSAQRLASVSDVGSSRPSRLVQTACSVFHFILIFLQLSVYDPVGCEGPVVA